MTKKQSRVQPVNQTKFSWKLQQQILFLQNVVTLITAGKMAITYNSTKENIQNSITSRDSSLDLELIILSKYLNSISWLSPFSCLHIGTADPLLYSLWWQETCPFSPIYMYILRYGPEMSMHSSERTTSPFFRIYISRMQVDLGKGGGDGALSVPRSVGGGGGWG